MTDPLATVPTLDEIAADPHKAANLPLETARTLLYRAVLVQNALLAPATTPSPASSQPDAQPSVPLTPEQAATKFNLSRRWLLAHARQIPGVVRLSRKLVRFDEEKLARWLALRGRRTPHPQS